MNKKILLGSITAVVILILVSFTGVIGYQTTKSSTIARASPLFSVRSTRAIDKQSKDIACDYVGKGEETNIQLPKRNTNGNLINQALNRMKRMDRDKIKRVLEKFMNNRDISNGEVIPPQLKTNPMIMNYINNSQFKADNLQTESCTFFENCGITFIEFGGTCLADWLFGLLIVIGLELAPFIMLLLSPLLLLLVIIWAVNTFKPDCYFSWEPDCWYP